MTANGGRHRAGDGATLGLAELDEAIALTIRVHSELIRARDALMELEQPLSDEQVDRLAVMLAPKRLSEAEYEEFAERWRSAYANGTAKPFFTPEPSPVIDDLTDDEVNSFHDAVAGRDLSDLLASYRVPPTVDMPDEAVRAVLKAVARCDLSVVRSMLSQIRTMTALRDELDPSDPQYGVRDEAVKEALFFLCSHIRDEKVWPQQAAHNRRDHIYHGGGS